MRVHLFRGLLAAVGVVLLGLAGVASAGTLLVVGDSLSTAYGMEPEEGWVQLLEERLQQHDPDFRVVNLSLSGETTGGGLARLPDALERHAPDIVIIELGGNDGLRGYPIDRIRANLGEMVTISLQSGAHVLLAGMHIPPNYGQRYVDAFHAIYQDLAEEREVSLVPFVLDGIATDPELMQRDGIHPTARAQPLLLDNVWPHVAAMLDAHPDVALGEALQDPDRHSNPTGG